MLPANFNPTKALLKERTRSTKTYLASGERIAVGWIKAFSARVPSSFSFQACIIGNLKKMMSFTKFLDVAQEDNESILGAVIYLAQTLEAIVFRKETAWGSPKPLKVPRTGLGPSPWQLCLLQKGPGEGAVGGWPHSRELCDCSGGVKGGWRVSVFEVGQQGQEGLGESCFHNHRWGVGGPLGPRLPPLLLSVHILFLPGN